MRGVKPEAGEPVDHDLREVVFKKNNYGPISESIILRWTDGLFLPVIVMSATSRAQITPLPSSPRRTKPSLLG